MSGHRFRPISSAPAILLCFVALLGCGDSLVLEDDAGAFRLRYNCSSFEPAAHSSSEFGLVRDYAVRAVSYANKDGNLDPVRRMMVADANGEHGELERLVVEYLCNGGRLEEPIPREPSDGPSVAELRERLRSKETPLEINTPAPEFRLPLLTPGFLSGDRSYLSLEDHRGDYVLISFWGTWCSPCLQEHLLLSFRACEGILSDSRNASLVWCPCTLI